MPLVWLRTGRPALLLVAKLNWLQPSPALLLIVVFAWPGKDEGDQLDKILSIMGQPTEASMPVSKRQGCWDLGLPMTADAPGWMAWSKTAMAAQHGGCQRRRCLIMC